MVSTEMKKRRAFGQHFTSISICQEFIIPEIESILNDYIWVDLFCGSGNLILPILDRVPKDKRIDFFKEKIYLFDIQEECIEESRVNAGNYGIPYEIAKNNITLRDSIKNYPNFLNDLNLPIFHITNPPYLYLGYIVKNRETQKYLPLFKGQNKGYQDLYQLALINDLRNNISKMIYIIPSNFIFGNSVSNKIRDDFFPHFNIAKTIIFEKKIFEYTGMNVMINFFERKKNSDNEPVQFSGKKIGKEIEIKNYILKPKYHYKAGNEFEEFIERFKSKKPLKLHYYLKKKEIEENNGDNKLSVIDANGYKGGKYQENEIFVNNQMEKQILLNILWVRTVDTGSWDGRVGLYQIRKSFQVDGILVTKNTYRTNPIQIFFDTPISQENQHLLLKYFNLLIEYLRTESDSEFMTTYKYSSASYTRKYFGLSQAKKLISTFPINDLNDNELNEFERIVNNEVVLEILKYLELIQEKKVPEDRNEKKDIIIIKKNQKTTEKKGLDKYFS